MATQTLPIKPLYTVYILRSTVRHSSLYIGSSPNPPRRLKQHNGEAKGGAARTSRKSLRPWEMVGVVSGFPGLVSALKFEWALNNPHISLHIPSTSRITIATQRKRSGHPRRPAHSMTSILSNIHLLLRVPSFARWPLTLHFFSKDVHAAWGRWCKKADQPMPDTVPVLTDFEPETTGGNDSGGLAPTATTETNSEENVVPPTPEPPPSWGIHALPLDYAPMRDYVIKTNSLFTFEIEGPCVICKEALTPGQGLYAVCPNHDCEAAGHVSCWSGHMLSQRGEDADHVIPIAGSCPGCGGEVRWVDMMKELTLRTRGPKEVEKLLKKPRKPMQQQKKNKGEDAEGEEDEEASGAEKSPKKTRKPRTKKKKAEGDQSEEVERSPKKAPKPRKKKADKEDEEDVEELEKSPKKARRPRKRKSEADDEHEVLEKSPKKPWKPRTKKGDSGDDSQKVVKKPRKAKTKKDGSDDEEVHSVSSL